MRTAALIAALAAALPASAAVPPRVAQMVVFRSGAVRAGRPSVVQAMVQVGRRRCAVAGGTPLAALVHSGVGPLSLRDYGSCSKRPADGAGLFVAAIAGDRNRGSDGWVYKVGNVLGTAGAADPSGPFGSGRLRAGARVTWFWCHVTARDRGCAQTLTLAPRPAPAGTLAARVRRFDDHGQGRAAAGAMLHVAGRTATAGRDGVARMRLRRGRYKAWAGQAGRIRSFAAEVVVR